MPIGRLSTDHTAAAAPRPGGTGARAGALSQQELWVRAQRRRALLEEIEQLRRLRSTVVPLRARRMRREQLQRMTRLLA